MKKKSAKKVRTPKKRLPPALMPNIHRGTVLSSIRPKNVLSFGDLCEPIDLTSLSVLIGPNGSGKSNLLDLVDLMRTTPTDFVSGILRGGGVHEWIWKGPRESGANIELEFINRQHSEVSVHHIAISAFEQSADLYSEHFFSRALNHPNGHVRQVVSRNGARIDLFHPHDSSAKQHRVDAPQNTSILEVLRDPENYPDISFVANLYKRIRLYRQWSFGRNSPLRKPQSTDARSDYLEEDFSNLALVLNRLRKSPAAKRTIIENLRDLYEGLTDFDVSVQGGSVLVYLTEGEFTIPAVRLSDGTLRYLGLLALLCDPDPPPLIGIEEPELGLHPDLIPKIADLLKEASGRCQLIVTTHSDILVSALSDCPESIIVCEKHDGQTTMRHLDPEELKPWLEKYRLGELWTRGQIGGVRW